MHKKRIKNFPRRKWIVPGPYHTIAADLVDYQKHSRKNGGMKYILVVIDCFSRYAYTRPLRTKKAVDTATALDDIITSMNYPPSILVSDKGTYHST